MEDKTLHDTIYVTVSQGHIQATLLCPTQELEGFPIYINASESP